MLRLILSGISLTALCSAGLPLAAQTAPVRKEASAPICALPQAPQWMGADEAGSVFAADLAAPLGQTSMLPTDAKAYYAFTVGADGTDLRLEAMATNGGDTEIELRDAAGEILQTNDDFGSSLNSRIDANLAAGTYCLGVGGLGGGGGFEVRVQAGLGAHEPLVTGLDPNAMAACTAQTQAQPLTQGALDAAFGAGIVRQSVGAEVSYVRFTLGEATPVTLRAVSDQLDPTMTLYDGNGAILGENDDADGTNARLDFLNALPAGDYCLGVRALSMGPGDIRIEAEKLDPAAFMRAAYLRGEIVPPSDSGIAITALQLSAKEPQVALLGTDAIWYSVDLEKETAFMLTAYGKLAGADTKLAIFNNLGQPIAMVDDQEGTTDAKLGPIVLQPGSYRVALTDIAGGQSARPVILQVERFERVQ